jgi:lysophospholipase L1-like esterase
VKPRTLARVAVVALTLLVGLGVAEVALRLSWKRTKPKSGQSWHDHDDRLGWRNKKSFSMSVEKSDGPVKIPVPFTVKLDAMGLRDEREIAPEPSAGVTRIACVGDSYTFGYLIEGERSYPARLEKALGPGYEAWNWGVCGYGLDQFVLMLDDALATHPKLVILGVIDMSFRRATNANFMDGTAKPRFYVEGGELVLTNVPVPLVKENDTYCRFDVRGHTYVAAGIGRAWENLSVKLSKDPEAAAEDWQLGRALILEAQRKCKAAGVRLAVALLPEMKLVGHDKYERLLATLEPEGITVLDVYPELAKLDTPELTACFVPEDGHPNERGAQLIADTLKALLEKRGLLAR